MICVSVLMRICGLLICWTILGTNGQGTMVEPPSRSSLWRLGFDTPINENDRLLSCGGVKHRWMKNKGQCGVCGDPWDSNPRPNEAGGLYASGVITNVYVSGSVIEVIVDVAVENGGYFEFRLCPHNSPSTPVSQECLDKGLLILANSSNISNGRFESVQQGLNKVELQLPSDIVCDQCILQWKYRTADHYGCEMNEKTNKEVCGFGLGKIQTEYFSCADVAIYDVAFVRSLHDSAQKMNTFVVNEPEVKKSRGKRATQRQSKRTLIFPNGQIQVMDYTTPFSQVNMLNRDRNDQNSFNEGPTVQRFVTGREMRWTWVPTSGSTGGDGTGRMRRRVQETVQSGMQHTLQRLPGQAFRLTSGGIRDPSNVNVGIGEMYPGGGGVMSQNMFAGDQGGQGRQVLQLKSRNGVTTIQVERGQGQVMQRGQPSGSSWVQESRGHMTGSQGRGQSQVVQQQQHQGVPMPAMAQVEPPTVRQVFRPDSLSARSPGVEAKPGVRVRPKVTQKTTRQQVNVRKLFLSTKQCAACPFDQCLDDYLNLENIFPGLFANPLQFLECRKYEKLFKLKKYDVLSDGLPECSHPRFRRQLRPPVNTRQFDDDDIGCCGTRSQVILPLTVESDNDTYNVVQLPNDRNQFLVQGICGRNSTVSCGTCQAEQNFQWVLVYDPRADTSPPVSFVPVKFPHYCRCMNVARKHHVIRT